MDKAPQSPPVRRQIDFRWVNALEMKTTTILAFLSLCLSAAISPAATETTPAPSETVAVASVPTLPDPDHRPNIVLILADDIGYEGLQCYGSASYHTPNLDRLASQGLQFTYAYAQPVCTPTRVQLLSGKYNVRNYIRFGEINPHELTIANYLRDRGYSTCIAGKWQLGGSRYTITNFGFDHYLLWWLEKKSQRYMNPGDFIQDKVTRPGKPGEYGPDIMNNYVLNFIKEHAHDQRPFFCYYPMLLVHAPFTPTPLSTARKTERTDPKFFPDMVAYADLMVGKVLDQLDALGIRDNTIVMFMGDNGTNDAIVSRMKDGTTIRGGKDLPTDAGTREPLLISWPAVIKPAVIDNSIADLTDFMPTLCEAAGYTAEDMPQTDGISLMPLFHGNKTGARDWSYCWISSSGSKDRAVKYARTIDYKLYSDGRFFDVPKDVLEQHPIPESALTKDQRAIRTRLQGILKRYDSVEAQRPATPPLPKFGKAARDD